MDHLTTFGAFILNKEVRYGPLEMVQNPYKFLQFLDSMPQNNIPTILQLCDNCKTRSFTDCLEITGGKSLFAHFYEYPKNQKEKKEKRELIMIWGDAVKKLETFVWILNHV